MSSRKPAAVRVVLCLLPLAMLACTSESVVEPEPVASANEAFTTCSRVNPDAYTMPIQDWDPADIDDLKLHGCRAPFHYYTGSSYGVLSGLMSVCRADRTAAAYVASRTNNPNAWAPADFCDNALDVLPKGSRYVVWSWSIGPNCSGCRDGSGGHASW